MFKRILIVEDEAVTSKHLQILFNSAGYSVCTIARSLKQSLEIIEVEKPQIVLIDILLNGKLSGIELARILNIKKIPFVYLSAISDQQTIDMALETNPFGFLMKPFREKEIIMALNVAYNIFIERQANHSQNSLLLELGISKIEIHPDKPEQYLIELAEIFQEFIPFDFLELGKYSKEGNNYPWISFLRVGSKEYQSIDKKALLNICSLNKKQLDEALEFMDRDILPQILNEEVFLEEIRQNPAKRLFASFFKVKTNLTFSIRINSDEVVKVSFYSKSNKNYSSEHLRLLDDVHSMLAVVSEQFFRKVKLHLSLKRSDVEVKADNFKDAGIIGFSKPIMEVFNLIKQVAVTDTSVLIMGETGTGKEKIAQQIHNLSTRSAKPLIKVNCAALPAELIEAELFGYEKGAFTGANVKRLGRFELANCGTIFLDEVGDMPSETQIKLLRVLQEKEIQVLGSTHNVKVDVRVIAATNKNLETEVALGNFRMDLYYRLYVFPILVPTLKERKEDIPALAQHFLEKFTLRHQKKIESITSESLDELISYDWPGNIRELENCLERTILLTIGKQIDKVFFQPYQIDSIESINKCKTIHDVEKEHILSVLKKSKNKVSGPGGAAEMLNLPTSTLTSKMKKLGISRV